MNRMMLGRKIGMTQIFTADGNRIPVTVVKVGPLTVVAKKSGQGKDGYAALKVGFEDADKQTKGDSVRWRGVSKARAGVFTKLNIDVPKKIVREFRIQESLLDNYAVGQILDHSMFNEGEFIDVKAKTKGRGFTGVMKRHNFSGFGASHGAHETHRGPGSIGCRATPGRVWPGLKMAGRYGGTQITVQNLRLVRILADEGVYLIRGAVPGANGGLVKIVPAVKKV